VLLAVACSVASTCARLTPRTCDYGIFAAQKSLSQNQVLTSPTQKKLANGQSFFLWQEFQYLFQTFEDLESVKDKRGDINAVWYLLDEKHDGNKHTV